MLARLFGKKRDTSAIDALYGQIVAAARRPVLFLDGGAPDTVMGRFETLTLHMALVLRRMRDLPPPANEVAQDLVDRFFAGLDDAMRQIGIGDTSVPKKVKGLAKAFYGRAGAYDAALAADALPEALEAAIARNILGRPEAVADARKLAAEARLLAARLANADLPAIMAGMPLLTESNAA
jgi:cytochrome b pre-mRNA-processing protein 3